MSCEMQEGAGNEGLPVSESWVTQWHAFLPGFKAELLP